jgi:DNA-binding FadR family transcriptional regulator
LASGPGLESATFDLLLSRADQESAESRLRRFIAQQGLQPGDKLPSEGELASIVGGSRIVVRKALHALEALGVVEARAGLGWFVRAFNVSTAATIFARSLTFHPRVLLDLIVVWSAVEADVVPGLAGKLSSKDFDVLGELADRMKWRAARREPFYREDGEFHRRLIAASGNLVALALVDLFWGAKETLYDSGFPPPKGRSQVVADSHWQILRALRAGDGPEAGRRVAEHHSHAKRYYVAKFEVTDQHAAQPAADSPFEALVQLALLDLGRNQRIS